MSRSVQNPLPSAFVTLAGVAARTPDGALLFDNLSLAFGRERTGLVGRNGVGKSTLLRLVAGLQPPSEGVISHVGTVGLLTQSHEPAADETAARTLGADRALRVLNRILAGAGSEADMEAADWTLEDRLARALDEVGLSNLGVDRPTASLSGGEQTRLRLAALMLSAPDLILLDEPTNHLDRTARDLVAGVIDGWPGGAVVVSHDRGLLRPMDRIVELSSLGAAVHGGGWDLYEMRRRAERDAAERDLDTARRAVDQAARETQRQAERSARRASAGRRFAASGSLAPIQLGLRADRAQDTAGQVKRVAEKRNAQVQAGLEAARERVEQVRRMTIPLPSAALPAGRTVLEMRDVVFRHRAPSGQASHGVGPINLRLTGPERIAVTGPNGAGKTTLLRLIAGELAPDQGDVRRPVRTALLDQNAGILDPGESLVEAWRRLNPEGGINEAHAALAQFLFRNQEAQRKAETLSGGERLRAVLACILTGPRPIQLLMLDEPTNHLDHDSIEAVEAALRGYDGAMVLVSHDAMFLERVGISRVLTLP